MSNDPVLRRRAHEIVSHFARQTADTQLLAFCLNQGEDFDLEQSVLLLSRTQYPDINPEAYSALLDDYAGDLRDRLDLNGDPGQILRVINEYLFRELKFTGDEHNLYDPDNSYFNRVMDRRTGNPDQPQPGLFVAGPASPFAHGGHRASRPFSLPLSIQPGRDFCGRFSRRTPSDQGRLRQTCRATSPAF